MPKPLAPRRAAGLMIMTEAGVAEHQRGKPVAQTLATAVAWVECRARKPLRWSLS